MTEKIPLVSVIIPMYNAEKFISQTLESLLFQTMPDFEVIVVDDCSTDNSVTVVESFAKIFNGRLQVIKLPTNNGSPAIPRNFGIELARGKYIAFLDSDDLFTQTALEELVTHAENFQADIVHTDEFFFFNEDNFKSATTEDLLNTKNHTVITVRSSTPLQQATDKPEEIAERVKLWVNFDYHWATSALFCRRDFLLINRIKFPQMTIGEDQIVNFACLCLAKKLLRVPNCIYIVRQRKDSISHNEVDLGKYFHKWLSSLITGFNEFNKVMNRVPFFSEHLDYRYAVLNYFFELMLRDAYPLRAAYEQIHPAALSPLVEKEFQPDDAAFAAYLFNTVNIQRLQLMNLQAEVKKIKGVIQ